ncbi:zinc finger CCCH domain-containing protein 59-like isoform X1 [Zingiber officinale]|uniref:zinc finger CCCH domain-containing protein 59-like isoform X1 n=1 Tax=Zingiber officinale TaxID=94328 RepID=UPI001C4B0E05|nr:zinc finger CCCH domain-containing protein 59-like isoform X1 [Zingiber officinale]
MEPRRPRILLCGDVLGRLNLLFKRVHLFRKSMDPFDALLCVGQFFPDSDDGIDEVADYFEGRSAVSIPTYFIGDYGVGAIRFLSAASKPLAARGFKTDGLEVCPNLFWLKGSGKFSLLGLSVVYLSGKQPSEDDGRGRYSEDDVGALRALAEEDGIVDLFLTNEWPSGVSTGADTSNAPSEVTDLSGTDPVISELAKEIMPRYHIAGTKGVFYEREPYSNDKSAHFTRFLGLASVGNKNKQKFIHGITPIPASIMSPSEISARPPNMTMSPYMHVEPASHASESLKRPDYPDSQYWRYDTSQKRQRKGGSNGEKLCFKFTSSGSCSQGMTCNFRHDEESREHYLRNVCFDFLNKGKCERGPDCKFGHSLTEEGASVSQNMQPHSGQGGRERTCWFCLSSPNVEMHLVLSIRESYYCALAKGPLVPNHVLLVSIEHCPNTLTMPSDTEAELEKYKRTLCKYFNKQAKAVVFFEWVSPQSPHANLQVIPIPLSQASNVKRIFKLASKKLGFEFEALKLDTSYCEGRKQLRSQFHSNSCMFYVELPDCSTLFHVVDDKKFPVQFGREVMSGMLNMADRADWRNCKLSRQEEEQMAREFKEGFDAFDPVD